MTSISRCKFLFKALIVVCAILVSCNVLAQPPQETDSARQKYLAAQKKIGRSFSDDFYPKFAFYNSLSPKEFLIKIETARAAFNDLLKEHSGNFDAKFIESEQIGIDYYFDKLILDYPTHHHNYTGKKVSLPLAAEQRLKKHLTDFNRPELLTNSDFTAYVRAFLDHRIDTEVKRPLYKAQDNQRLNAVWRLIPTLFTDQATLDFWRYDFLFNHIDNLGIKNIGGVYGNFSAVCKNKAYRDKVTALYNEDLQGRQGLLTKTYKKIGKIDLDIHLFLPKDAAGRGPKPAIVFFHGGSWSEGKPDYFFEECRRYAEKGWVAAAVEYRIFGRHGTLPFEAVKDAKSAIRWLRKNARELGIDPEKIAASGNSAGGHLVLASALAETVNEKTDDLRLSSVPNALLVTSGVYDLTDEKTAWIRRDLKNKDMVNDISPNDLIKKKLPPTLLIHGTADANCPYPTAETFKARADKFGDTVKLYTLTGAGHFVWFDPKYAGQVSKEKADFLKSLGW